MPDTDEKTALTTKKRRLSTSEAEKETGEGASKRAKNETVGEFITSTSTPLDTSENIEVKGDEGYTSVDIVMGDTELFYLYGDGMITVFECMDMESIVRRKVEVDQAWEELEARKAGGEDADSLQYGYAENMAQWAVGVADEDESRNDSRAQNLLKQWKEERGTGTWWYELTMQRQEPAGETQDALEVVLDCMNARWADSGKAGEGTWWITGFKAADVTQPALKYFSDHVPDVD